MINYLIGIFLILHGLVHFWFVTLSLKLVEFQEDMGWNNESWLFSPFMNNSTSSLISTGLYGLSAILFIITGLMLILNSNSWQDLIIASIIVSTVTIFVFWDGNFDKLIEKGLIGLIINIVIGIALIFK